MTSLLVFNRVYRQEIQSVMLVMLAQLCELLPLSPSLWFTSPTGPSPPFQSKSTLLLRRSTQDSTDYITTSGFWPRVRARALRAPVFLGSLPRQTGRCAPPPPIAASLLLIQPPKIFTIYRTWAAHVQGFFLSNEPQRLWNMRSPSPPRPSQLCWSFRQYFWGQIM